MNMLQVRIFNFIADRGYANKTTPAFIKDNILKMVEKWGNVMEIVSKNMTPPPYELAEVLIPCLCIAHLCNYDLLPAIEESLGDVPAHRGYISKPAILKGATVKVDVALGNLAGNVFYNRIPSLEALIAVCLPIFQIAQAHNYNLTGELETRINRTNGRVTII